MRFILFLFAVLFSALILSALSLTTYVEERRDSVEISLANGVYESLYDIYGYDYSLGIYDVRLNITSYCGKPLNITIIKIYENKSIEKYEIGSYGRLTNIDCGDMYSILDIDQRYNCTLRIDASYKIEHKPYLILAVPAFILFMIGTALVFGMMFRGLR